MKNIKPDESSFNYLMQVLLTDLYKDLEEAESNVKRYSDLVADTTNDMNLAMYGPLLNDALKIKAAVRDKILKMLNTMKDRVRTKEQQASAGSGVEEYTEEMLSELAFKIKEKNG